MEAEKKSNWIYGLCINSSSKVSCVDSSLNKIGDIIFCHFSTRRI